MFWKALFRAPPRPAAPDRSARIGPDTPLIAYIHVPKTAGSTVNHVLKMWDRRGQDHCEAIIDDPARLAQRVADIRWISGHVTLPVMRDALSAVTARPTEFFGLVRDPTAQVISHYNWLIEIFHRGGEFYFGHPPEIREISERIRASDHADPAAIIANLSAFSGLFLNQQSRCVLGMVEEGLTEADLREGLAAYACVTTEAELPELILRATGRRLEGAPRKNQSPYHFDRAVFATPELRAFLAEHNALDQRLYDLVSTGLARAA
jgi:hypothetical protein